MCLDLTMEHMTGWVEWWHDSAGGDSSEWRGKERSGGRTGGIGGRGGGFAEAVQGMTRQVDHARPPLLTALSHSALASPLRCAHGIVPYSHAPLHDP